MELMNIYRLITIQEPAIKMQLNDTRLHTPRSDGRVFGPWTASVDSCLQRITQRLNHHIIHDGRLLHRTASRTGSTYQGII